MTTSVACNVVTESLECEGSVVVGVTARRIKLGKGCVAYNVIDKSEEGLVLADGDVIVGIVGEDGSQMIIRSNQSIDGGKAWKEVVCDNPHSFEALHALNGEANLMKMEEVRLGLAESAKEELAGL